MLLAESAAGDAAARALSRAYGGACELFGEAGGPRYLALVPDRRARPAWTFQAAEPRFEGGRHGPLAGEWLFRVGLWVPREHRDEFLSWYEQEHLPILLECAAWDGCRFVEVPNATGCQFFALHQLADRAALASAERARSRATRWFADLKQFAWFDEPFSRVLYRRVALP